MKNPLSPKRRKDIGGFIAIAAVFPGLAITLGGILTLMQQVGGWLKTGVWTSHTVFEPLHRHLGLNHPKMSWWAAQKLTDFLLSLPASLCLIVVGLFLALGIGFAIAYPLDWLGLLPDEEGAID